MHIGPHPVGQGPLLCILGPCVLESEEGALRIAEGIAEVCARLGVAWVFKASFDKANRSSAGSFRGPGVRDGLATLARIGARVGVPLTTDIHLPEHAAMAAEVVDLLQVPAFLCRQTDLLEAAAETGKPVNVKKGQFVAPADMANVLGKLRPGLAMLTERGASFGYNNLVVDYRSLPMMRALGVPVCFDATHSVQMPGGATTGGDRRWVSPLARAAAAVGIDALFCEVHDRPEEALSDGPNMVRLTDLEALLRDVLAVRAAVGEPAPLG
ncbi:MAG: 3-deoxy-8-phosphooctulonate synthase [Pseudomonadota bacterium]|nr:3-deoxy-8-phosphooctulonate synthase [Pseudomonadota bacterium]